MAAEVESNHGEKPVYRKMAEFKKKIALVEVRQDYLVVLLDYLLKCSLDF